MSLVTLERGLWWPDFWHNTSGGGGESPTSWAIAIDATGEKVAFLGQISIVGGATSKTFSSAGAKIHFLAGSRTFATAGSVIRIGLQGFSTTAGPPRQPDGTWSTYKDMTQGTDTFTANAWNSITMAAGTATISDGDDIAVVFDFTTRNGADALQVMTYVDAVTKYNYGVTTYLSSTWEDQGSLPQVIIEFDDGTLATIDNTCPISAHTSSIASFTDASNPDENGLIFTAPFTCTIDSARLFGYVTTSAASDATVTLYSDPLGTPTSMGSFNIYGERTNASNSLAKTSGRFASQITLQAGTTYCLAIKATSTGNISLRGLSIADANYRQLLNGGTSCRLGYRQNSTGAFSETTTTLPQIDMRIKKIDDGTGGGRASLSIGI